MARSDAAIYHLNKQSSEVILASKEPEWPFNQYSNFKYVRLTNVDARTRFYNDQIKTQIWHGKNSDLSPYRKHLIELFSLLEREKPNVVVVDSTPEIAVLAKLLGFKTIFVYETMEMDRTELRFDLAWKNSDKIIFPYPEYFIEEMKFNYPQNTINCGGYTRLENDQIRRREIEKGNILISFGKGEKSDAALKTLIKKLTEKFSKISVLSGGIDIGKYSHLPVEFVKKDQNSVLEALQKAEIYICGAGYNTLMEGFYLRKRIITIPLERPYNEQIIKAKIFEKHGALIMLMPEKAENILGEVEKVMQISDVQIAEIHKEIVRGSGAKKAADAILELADGGKL